MVRIAYAMVGQVHHLTAHDWLTLAALATILAASLLIIFVLYPRVARALDVNARIERAAHWALNQEPFSKAPWAQRFLQRLLVNTATNLAAQTIQTVIILPVAFVAWGSIWLFDHLPLIWTWVIEQAPWIEGAVPIVVVIAGLSIIAIGFWLRETHARTYGVIEIGVAIAALYLVGRSTSVAQGLLPFASAVYVGVRGCDNVRRGIKIKAEKNLAAA